MGQEIAYDADGNVKGGVAARLFPADGGRDAAWETDYTVTPSPHHPIGAKGVGESPKRRQRSVFRQTAVNDAFKFLARLTSRCRTTIIASGSGGKPGTA